MSFEPRLRLSARACAIAALAVALLASACQKRIARTTPEALVPSIETEPKQPPEVAMPPLPPPPGPELGPPAPPPKAAEKSRHHHHKPPHKPAVHSPAEAHKGEKTAPEASTQETPPASGSPAQISAAVPAAAAQSQTHNTEQLLRSSEAKLSGLGRSLNSNEKAMAQQARSYIDQSSEAMRSGDLERAYNLAMKASLLVNELAK